MSATETTIGTKYLEIVSTSLSTGPFVLCASCTTWTILESVVSVPTLVALTLREPCPLIVAPMTGRSEERRVGKECRSLCDWSSDVCSSDLLLYYLDNLGERRIRSNLGCPDFERALSVDRCPYDRKIGRASCRERV